MKRPGLAMTAGLFALTLAKYARLQDSLELLNPVYFLLGTAPFLLILYLSCHLLPNRWYWPTTLGLHGLLAFVAFADLLYSRFFCTVVPVQAVTLLGQTGGVMDSIADLFSWADAWFWLDLPVVIWLGWRYPRLRSRLDFGWGRRRAGIALLLTALLPVSSTLAMAKPQVLSTLGALPYHIRDTVDLMRPAAIGHDLGQLLLEKEQARHTRGTQYRGLAAGRNVIVIQMESLQNFVLQRTVAGQEITPVMNRLIAEESFYFSRYYQVTSVGATSDAEFSSHNSLYPSLDMASYSRYQGKKFYTLPGVLQAAGYQTIAFHGYEPDFWNRQNIYPEQGLAEFVSGRELEIDEVIGMGLSDASFFRQVSERLESLPQPFYAFLITLTNHYPWPELEGFVGLELPEDLQGTVLGRHLQHVYYVDYCLGWFLDQLKSQGLYDNSLIAIYGDHFAMRVDDPDMNQQTSQLLGREYGYDEMLRVPLLIHIPGSGVTREVGTTGGQIDFFPTMLNLLGLEPDPHCVLAGQDLLNAAEGFVALKILSLEKGSFVDNEVMLEMARDGRFENSRAWRLDNGEPVDIAPYRQKSRRAALEWDLSAWILNNDLVGSAELRP
ncbi:MAG: LTA synthase family protein [Bacillota bacterium]|jgi:lipoteichoic acid synthase